MKFLFSSPEQLRRYYLSLVYERNRIWALPNVKIALKEDP
jgi:hypothetical protein